MYSSSELKQHDKKRRNYFAAIFTILLVATVVWAAKEPKFKDIKKYVPPTSADGTQCINKCSSIQEQCMTACSIAYQSCDAEAKAKAKPAHERALKAYKKRSPNNVCYGDLPFGVPTQCMDVYLKEPTLSDFETRARYDLGCDSTCGCVSKYDSCYTGCGGSVFVETTCVKNCGEMSEDSKYYKKLQKKLTQTSQELAEYDKKMKKDERYMKPSPGKALVYVIRPAGTSFIYKYDVSIDNESIGVLQSKSYLVKEITPGWHIVSTKRRSVKRRTVAIPLKADKVYFVKVDPSSGKLIILTLGQGTKQLKQCKKK